jgi:hypothetical protein
VRSIPGLWTLTRGAAEDAQAEGALAFPLCRHVVAAVEVSALAPYTDADGLGGSFSVDGTAASSWNLSHVRGVFDEVSLDGPLPAARLTARARGGTVRGVLTDCTGFPLPRVAVHGGGGAATTGANGAYTLRPRHAGRLRVTATAGGATVSSAAVTLRAG